MNIANMEADATYGVNDLLANVNHNLQIQDELS